MLENLQAVPIDPIFQLLYDYRADERANKVNLGIGIYATPEGEPYVFPSVKQAFSELDTENFNYQPIGGNQEYLELVADLVFDGIDQNSLAMQTTCGGTQACRLFADLMAKDEVKRTAIIGDPTWSNHYSVFQSLPVETCSHLDEEGGFDFDSYVQAVERAEEGSLLILHGGLTHNPTGRNLSQDQLEELIPKLREKGMIVYVDYAYCGFGEGFSLDKKFIQSLFSELDEVAVGLSFSKNASLYEHRTGALFVKTDRKEVIESHLQEQMRQSVSMSPGIGQEIMITVLQKYRKQWLAELEEVRLNIEERKAMLLDALPESFAPLRETRGLFALLPFDADQIQRLRDEHAIYLPANARINFGGIRTEDVQRIAEAMVAVSET